ncbi:hypothetical protein EVAR_31335_1 [Eumeta japonica]|uniref:Reverse transcriptase domain-containing protein n=1 Tax=Eumeta variegata TaxID=151549 RepID=A0A4C1Y1R8_EUMVA|nr:hypothetical protein EVAR_31335_1 [Eumeta japonica]
MYYVVIFGRYFIQKRLELTLVKLSESNKMDGFYYHIHNILESNGLRTQGRIKSYSGLDAAHGPVVAHICFKLTLKPGKRKAWKANAILEAISKAHGMLTGYSKSGEQANSASSRVTTTCKPVKLPTIQQPKFSGVAHFIPHDGVLLESSTTAKLLEVFDASSPTTSGVSFNNIQMVDPTVQDKVLSILLCFRRHKYVLSADVEKMYRQIVVHPHDRHLQQIVWRDSPTDPLETFELNTIAYGTAGELYLGNTVCHDFYVDDLLTCGDDIDKIQSIRKKVESTFASAHMLLRKWRSNKCQRTTEPNQDCVDLNIGIADQSKTLGLSGYGAGTVRVRCGYGEDTVRVCCGYGTGTGTLRYATDLQQRLVASDHQSNHTICRQRCTEQRYWKPNKICQTPLSRNYS